MWADERGAPTRRGRMGLTTPGVRRRALAPRGRRRPCATAAMKAVTRLQEYVAAVVTRVEFAEWKARHTSCPSLRARGDGARDRRLRAGVPHSQAESPTGWNWLTRRVRGDPLRALDVLLDAVGERLGRVLRRKRLPVEARRSMRPAFMPGVLSRSRLAARSRVCSSRPAGLPMDSATRCSHGGRGGVQVVDLPLKATGVAMCGPLGRRRPKEAAVVVGYPVGSAPDDDLVTELGGSTSLNRANDAGRAVLRRTWSASRSTRSARAVR